MMALTFEQNSAIGDCEIRREKGHGEGKNRLFELKIPTYAEPGQEQ